MHSNRKFGKIAVTGASGFLGQNLCSYLEDGGYDISKYSRRDFPGFEKVNYFDHHQLAERLDGIETIVHLAGIAHNPSSSIDKSAYKNAIYDTSLNLLNAALATGCKRIIFASTCKVYGESSGNAILSEDSMCRPLTPYGIMKLKIEDELMRVRQQIHINILRFPPIYGAGMRGAIKYLFKAARYYLPLPVESFEHNRTFLSIENAVRFIEAGVRGNLETPILIPHEGQPTSVGKFYTYLWLAAHDENMPETLHWKLPGGIKSALEHLRLLEPLFRPFAMRSKHRIDSNMLALVAPIDSMRKFFHG
ncbi:MAG: NAD-dependent epimerase/dehydratase family protein [Deltaproteobacteria bacterium]|nr:NAD-dependent epimerase/dehydratase family protein [Deltaproteobacteria bacterium]